MSLKKENSSVSLKISFTAVFAALCCACTFVAVPLPFGYFNLGDVFVLLSAWLLGPVLGPLAAGVGTALADIFMGYAVYAPATLIIKALVALVAFCVYKLMKKCLKKEGLDFISRSISAIVGESIMVLGYFFFEAVLLGYGLAATASIFGNCLQAVAGTVGSVFLVSAIYSIKPAKRYFDK
ncbi:MAG: ECF transporter S component [Clostridia bacterium]|nr:ECF transporter S component [Clostridia bacterium]